MKFHEMGQTDLLEATNTSMKQGLTEKEVKKRLDKHGPNELQEGKKTSALILFLAQFKDFMVLVLLAATLISGFLGEYVDAVAIIAIVFVNGILGFFQERRAEQSLQALKELSTPHVMALREGSWTKIPSKELVPGDIVKFTSGDRIGADVRIVEAKSLEIEESALTGESIPVVKHADKLKKPDVSLGDITNMAFMGTIVTRGSGVGVVVGTGMNTAMGKIADMLESAGTLSTPLQRRLEQLGKILNCCRFAAHRTRCRCRRDPGTRSVQYVFSRCLTSGSRHSRRASSHCDSSAVIGCTAYDQAKINREKASSG